MQKTDFPIELVIGEDCSTDGTRDIVFSYARKYPEIIRTVTSDSNVGMVANARRTAMACKGEYVAICEGDDYWIDPLKLQKQYDAAREYDAVLVAHDSIFLRYKGSKFDGASVRQASEHSGFLSAEDIIFKSASLHTSSLFFRTDLMATRSRWLVDGPVDDNVVKLHALGNGKIYYINEIMSVRQKGMSGSWSEMRAIREATEEAYGADYERNHLAMLMQFDVYTERKYASLIHRRICDRLERYLERKRDLDLLETPGMDKAAARALVRIAPLLPGRMKRPAIRRLVEHAWESSTLREQLGNIVDPS